MNRQKLSIFFFTLLLAICGGWGIAPADSEAASHSADYKPADYSIGLSELLRGVQLYNDGAYHCAPDGEDGYAPGDGDRTCAPHHSDYNPQDWRITLSELLRLIQFYQSEGYHADAEKEDGFGVGKAQVEGAELVRSDLSRSASPDVSEADLQELVSGNTDFALALYHAVSGESENLFFSPYSISLALAMTYAGARNDTEHQMADALRFTLPQERLHPAFNALDLELARHGEETGAQDENRFRLNIANSIWGQTGYSFLPTFLDVLAENYGAGLRLLDFVSATEDSRIIINNWVSDQTENKINDLLPQGSLSPLTRLVLTNAIYFNGPWLHPFREASTTDAAFHLPDAGQVTVPMMRQTEHFNYAEGDGYQAVELHYGSEPWVPSGFSMVVLLPRAGEFENFEASLDSAKLNAVLESLHDEYLELGMPRFKYESGGISLGEILAQMGMPVAFSGSADFSGMNGTRELSISNILHKAFVSVNEIGTEAAAATAVIMVASIPPEPVAVTIDRPFIFLIRDIKTGAILFMGRIVNPG